MLQNVHICCLVLGLLLLATSVTHVQGAEETIHTDEVVRIRRTISASECTLTLPNKTVCHYEYGAGSVTPTTLPSLPGEICEIPANLYPSYGPCDFTVNITSKILTGVYRLKYELSGGTVGEDTFYVYLRSGGVPTGTLQVVEDENFYLRLEDSFENDNDKKCEIVYPNRTSDILLNSSYISPNHWGTKDECGFKVEGVATSDSGNWALRMSSSGGAYTFADFAVTVIPLDQISSGEIPTKEWLIGDTQTLYLSKQPYSKYCELWNPRKELVQRASVCNYKQPFVTDADEGNWTFVFGIYGKLSEETLVQEIDVKKRDIEATVSVSERFPNGKSLLCNIYPGPVTDCRFTRPDGEVILLNEGIGNANYSYFGDGFSGGHCGLTIHKVQEEDKGVWKCSVSDWSTQMSGFLNVSSEFPDIEVETHRTPVVVKDGSELQLSCTVQRPLEYCWFRHPSGAALRFSTEWVSQTYRQYAYDDTLQEGVCTIRVLPAISSEDSGEWTCNLGVIGSPEEDYAKPITVGVSETDVISMEKELVVSEGPAVLKCYSVPLGIPLEYCRFIRPDGKGFSVDAQNNNTVLGRYRYEAEGLANGECGLRIVSEINEDEDVGKWTCVARLQGRKEEGQDYITVKTDDGLSTGAIVGIVLGAVALLLVIAGTAYLIVRCRKAT